MIGKHTEAANRAIDRVGYNPDDDSFDIAARMLIAFAHELDAAGDVDLLNDIRRAVRTHNGGDVQVVLDVTGGDAELKKAIKKLARGDGAAQ